MPQASVDGVALEYELRGAGEPVVLIHWGVCAAWAEPLLDAPALNEHYRLLAYDRAGFGASSRVDGPLGMADHAEHCRLLMAQLDIDRAHVVGHSSSAMIVLQLAVDAPDAVHTLALLDPARPAPRPRSRRRSCARSQGPRRALPGGRRGRRGRHLAAGVFGPDYRTMLDEGIPGAAEQALAEAGAFFGQELPAVQQWDFTEEHARRIDRPVLVATGEDSAPTFAERRELLLSWLPRGESFDLPGANHLMHAQNPRAMAEALAAFFARHPLPGGQAS